MSNKYMPKIIFASPLSKRNRCRVRHVDEHKLVEQAVTNAKSEHKTQIMALHGGSVCNNYGYYASTEGALVVAFPDGRAVCWQSFLPAHAVTYSGVAANCLDEKARPMFDSRFGSKKTREAKRYIRKMALAELGTKH